MNLRFRKRVLSRLLLGACLFSVMYLLSAALDPGLTGQHRGRAGDV